MAIERGYEYYFWGHADVAVIGKDESASFADDVIACVESSLKSRPNWGIIYFHYDWFSAIRTDLVRQVTPLPRVFDQYHHLEYILWATLTRMDVVQSSFGVFTIFIKGGNGYFPLACSTIYARLKSVCLNMAHVCKGQFCNHMLQDASEHLLRSACCTAHVEM